MNVVLDKLRGAARRVVAHFSERAVILLYHRVADVQPGGDPHNLAVSPARFAEQMEVLKRKCPVLPLRSLTEMIQQGRMPARCAAVTFDDGYADNLHVARPILERADVPATVFVTTGDAGRGEEFYWDECERLIHARPAPQQPLRLSVNGGSREWSIDGAPASAERRETLLSICDVIRELRPAERRPAMQQIRGWAGTSSATVRDSHRAMTDEEIARLSGDDAIVDIGAHTENHPALPSLTPQEQSDEIVRSKKRLESILGCRVKGFAYPYGMYSSQTREAVHAAGLDFTCATLEHAARLVSDELCLPRFDMGNCDGDAFARKLRWAFGR